MAASFFFLEISFHFFFSKNHFMGFWSDMESNKTPLFQAKNGGKKKLRFSWPYLDNELDYFLRITS